MASGEAFAQRLSDEFKKKLKHYEEEERRAMSGTDADSYLVELYVYDMSKGLAKSMSPALLGKQIEGLWHTGVVAYGREYFFGSGGIESCRPGGTILGEPERIEDLGSSQVPYQLFLEYIFGLGESSYKPGAYDLLRHNCNNFSEEVSEFLCGRGIPKHILTLPDEVLNTPLGETLSSLAKALQLKNNDTPTVNLCGINNTINKYVPQVIHRTRDDPEFDELNSAIEEVRQNTQALEHRRNSINEKLLRKERKEKKKEKRKKKKHRSSSVVGAEEDRESSRLRRTRGSCVRFASDETTDVPSTEHLQRRRFSDPVSPEPRLPPPFPTTKRPPVPPSEKKSSGEVSPSEYSLASTPPTADLDRNPSPPPSSSRILTATMDGDGSGEVPPPEESPASPAAEHVSPQDLEGELPPEVEREPPILFKEEVDVSSRGTFGDVLSPLARSLSNHSVSSYSSGDDDDDDLSSVSSSSSSLLSSSSSSTSSLSSSSSSSSSYSSNSVSSCSSSSSSLESNNLSTLSSVPGVASRGVSKLESSFQGCNDSFPDKNYVHSGSPGDSVFRQPNLEPKTHPVVATQPIPYPVSLPDALSDKTHHTESVVKMSTLSNTETYNMFVNTKEYSPANKETFDMNLLLNTDVNAPAYTSLSNNETSVLDKKLKVSQVAQNKASEIDSELQLSQLLNYEAGEFHKTAKASIDSSNEHCCLNRRAYSSLLSNPKVCDAKNSETAFPVPDVTIESYGIKRAKSSSVSSINSYDTNLNSKRAKPLPSPNSDNCSTNECTSSSVVSNTESPDIVISSDTTPVSCSIGEASSVSGATVKETASLLSSISETSSASSSNGNGKSSKSKISPLSNKKHHMDTTVKTCHSSSNEPFCNKRVKSSPLSSDKLNETVSATKGKVSITSNNEKNYMNAMVSGILVSHMDAKKTTAPLSSNEAYIINNRAELFAESNNTPNDMDAHEATPPLSKNETCVVNAGTEISPSNDSSFDMDSRETLLPLSKPLSNNDSCCTNIGKELSPQFTNESGTIGARETASLLSNNDVCVMTSGAETSSLSHNNEVCSLKTVVETSDVDNSVSDMIAREPATQLSRSEVCTVNSRTKTFHLSNGEAFNVNLRAKISPISNNELSDTDTKETASAVLNNEATGNNIGAETFKILHEENKISNISTTSSLSNNDRKTYATKNENNEKNNISKTSLSDNEVCNINSSAARTKTFPVSDVTACDDTTLVSPSLQSGKIYDGKSKSKASPLSYNEIGSPTSKVATMPCSRDVVLGTQNTADTYLFSFAKPAENVPGNDQGQKDKTQNSTDKKFAVSQSKLHYTDDEVQCIDNNLNTFPDKYSSYDQKFRNVSAHVSANSDKNKILNTDVFCFSPSQYSKSEENNTPKLSDNKMNRFVGNNDFHTDVAIATASDYDDQPFWRKKTGYSKSCPKNQGSRGICSDYPSSFITSSDIPAVERSQPRKENEGNRSFLNETNIWNARQFSDDKRKVERPSCLDVHSGNDRGHTADYDNRHNFYHSFGRNASPRKCLSQRPQSLDLRHETQFDERSDCSNYQKPSYVSNPYSRSNINKYFLAEAESKDTNFLQSPRQFQCNTNKNLTSKDGNAYAFGCKDYEVTPKKPPMSPRKDIGKSDLLINANRKKATLQSYAQETVFKFPYRTSEFIENLRRKYSSEASDDTSEISDDKDFAMETVANINETNEQPDLTFHLPRTFPINSPNKLQFFSDSKSKSGSPDTPSFHTPTYSPDGQDFGILTNGNRANTQNKFNFKLPSPEGETFHTPTYNPSWKDLETRYKTASCYATENAFNFSEPTLSSDSALQAPSRNDLANEKLSVSVCSTSTLSLPSDDEKSIMKAGNISHPNKLYNTDDLSAVPKTESFEELERLEDSVSQSPAKSVNINISGEPVPLEDEADTSMAVMPKNDNCHIISMPCNEHPALSITELTLQQLDGSDSISPITDASQNADISSDRFSAIASSAAPSSSSIRSPATAEKNETSEQNDQSEQISKSAAASLNKAHMTALELLSEEPLVKDEMAKSCGDITARPPPSCEADTSDNKKKETENNSSTSSNNETGDESGLSRSSTQSSVDSSTSFGSSYYTLYIVDPNFRPKTPEEDIWSPETSPPPEDLCRSNSTASVSSFRTITPEPEYFEANTRAFRAMRGLSLESSNESIKTCRSASHSLGSTSTLCHDSEVPNHTHRVKNTTRSSLALNRRLSSWRNDSSASSKITSTSVLKSLPVSPNRSHNSGLAVRSYSLDSLHSVIRKCPNLPSPFTSISTFDLASSLSSSPRPSPRLQTDRPPSTDSPILFDSPGGSQDSLLLFRPLPRYSTLSDSPEPEPTILCYLGPVRPFEPPLIFDSILQETVADFDGFVNVVAEMLSPDEQRHMEELRAYVVEDEGSWALGEDFNCLFARIFHDPAIPDEARRHLVRIMAAAALKDDVILMLHQDRKEHTIMNFANKVESLSPDIQEALALFFCNMFEHLSPSEWLLYISEWAEGSQQISNIRVTTKVAVNALLHSNPKVQEYGTALMYNLGTKEVKTVVFDDVAPELAMAILQYFGSNPPEEQVWRVMTALCRFCYASTEVPALIKMIGPDPNTYKGMSERIDQALEELNTKLSRVRTF